MDMDMAIHITEDITGEERSDPLKPNQHQTLKLKANHGMDTMATPAITVTDITTGVKTHNGLISGSIHLNKFQRNKMFLLFCIGTKIGNKFYQNQHSSF